MSSGPSFTKARFCWLLPRLDCTLIDYDDIGAKAILVFIFDAGDRAYKDHYPVVLRVTTFGAEECYATKLCYTNRISFVKPEASGREDVDEDSDNDQVTIAATWVEIDHGQQTILAFNDPVCQFSVILVATPALHSVRNPRYGPHPT
ncbi:hypothetical protein PAXINDRAFT_8514 [Paxillus involutus ATCC 200175]|nr:hypothetical protein PAXINDRAFT_8514 [Paxillus involutus ATCC 200175]